MPTHIARIVLPGISPDDVRAWHDRPGAFDRLAPPWARLQVHQRPRRIARGEVAQFDAPLGPTRHRWTSQITEVSDDGFVDTAPLPLGGRWRHTHRWLAHPDGCELVDEVDWHATVWTTPCLQGWVTGELERLLSHRHAILAADLQRWGQTRHEPRRVIGVTGASGSVGSALCAFLTTQGHRVVPFVRDGQRVGIPWRPTPGGVQPTSLEPLDAIVHLAGATVAQRWTSRALAEIRDSRVLGTTAIAEAIAASERKPRLISASAVGWYGHRPEAVDEQAAPGQGFLAEVGVAWEQAAEPARRVGAAVVHPRIGLVLDASHGALAGMLPAFRLGLGGPLGAGDQPFPWIARDDLLDVLALATRPEHPDGVVNAVAPEAVDQRTFALALGQALSRPARLPVPGFVVRTLAGQMGQALLLEGARAVPAVLLRQRHAFRWPHLLPALRHAVGRPPP